MTVLAVLENTLRSFCLSYKRIQDEEATVTVLTLLAVLEVMAVSVMTATPLKLNPPFRDPDLWGFPNCLSFLSLFFFLNSLFSSSLQGFPFEGGVFFPSFPAILGV